MKTTTIEFILRAEQPIAHHEESIGNQAVSMRRKIRQPDGTFQLEHDFRLVAIRT